MYHSFLFLLEKGWRGRARTNRGQKSFRFTRAFSGVCEDAGQKTLNRIYSGDVVGMLCVFFLHCSSFTETWVLAVAMLKCKCARQLRCKTRTNTTLWINFVLLYESAFGVLRLRDCELPEAKSCITQRETGWKKNEQQTRPQQIIQK